MVIENSVWKRKIIESPTFSSVTGAVPGRQERFTQSNLLPSINSASKMRKFSFEKLVFNLAKWLLDRVEVLFLPNILFFSFLGREVI